MSSNSCHGLINFVNKGDYHKLLGWTFSFYDFRPSINALPEPGNGQLTLAKIPPRKLTFPAKKKRKKTTLGYDDTSKDPYASDFIPSIVFVCATRPRQMIRFEKLHHSPHDLLTIADATKEKPKKDHSKKRTISEIERAET
ncbi:hypothetical protein TNCT_588531 [Trichonephila clavata]|uniref:Uncharacterized protein n=1 Tax=Trichonephila clavata TaxID=2740835 RepID=A0A8X6J3L5_TRICU|nr:hypothetical protein TNCT_588531 [Trichonephila clavata]